MIDLGLSKLAIIGVVALVVIGPEKLPKVARMAGTLYGRAQRYLHDVKSEVSREIELDELRNLHKEVQETRASRFKADVESTDRSSLSTTSRRPGAAITAHAAHAAGQRRATSSARRATSAARSWCATRPFPAWYKHRHGGKPHVLSGAARVRKFRPARQIQHFVSSR